jgi:hypothetical protein
MTRVKDIYRESCLTKSLLLYFKDCTFIPEWIIKEHCSRTIYPDKEAYFINGVNFLTVEYKHPYPL